MSDDQPPEPIVEPPALGDDFFEWATNPVIAFPIDPLPADEVIKEIEEEIKMHIRSHTETDGVLRDVWATRTIQALRQAIDCVRECAR